eukprot:5039384-Pleurochrysis_carterae.AAC.2
MAPSLFRIAHMVSRLLPSLSPELKLASDGASALHPGSPHSLPSFCPPCSLQAPSPPSHMRP